MKWKNRIAGAIFGSVIGAILIVYLLHKGTSSEEIVFGASLWLSRIYVFIICLISSVVSEMTTGKSAGEVFVDMFISAITVCFCVNESTLVMHEDSSEIFFNVYKCVLIVIGLATFLSSPIKKWLEGILDKDVHSK